MRLHKAFVVTPPSLGDRRLARFEKHMKMLHPEFPPLEIAEGVNKNWINFSDAPEFIPLFVDNRDIWTKFKIRRGLEKNAIPFRGSGIADLFTLGDKAIWIGAIGSAVGHIRAWREIAKLPGPAVVFEDDRLLKQSVVLTNLPEPCDSNYLITLIPSAVGFTQKIEYDDTYWEITKTRGELAEIKERFFNHYSNLPERERPSWEWEGQTHDAGAYIVTPDAAKNLLEAIVPMPSHEGIDVAMFYDAPIRVFATKEELVIQSGARSMRDNRNITLRKLFNPSTLLKAVRTAFFWTGTT